MCQCPSYQFYEYNQRGLLAKVFVNTSNSKPSTAEVTYTYTATGAVDYIDYKGNKDADYGYTIRDWVDKINNVGSPSGNFAADYDYFDNGNVQKAQFHNPQNQISGHDRYHQSFTYDGLSRLKSADYGPGSDSSSSYFDVSGLDYDVAGNITDLQRNDDSGNLIDNLSYSYSGSNRLQSVTDAVGSTSEPWDAETVNRFGYDDNGNLTSQSGKLDDVTYEHRNLPTQFALASSDTVIANYNADGQRILKELKNGSWKFYVMDGQQTLAVIDNSGFSHFNLVGNSTFGRWEPGGARRYYLTDHLGSMRAVVDDGGNVLETFDYYPFGLLMPRRNTAGANTIEKFTGKERDTEANLNLDYFGARYYDAAIGRWHNVDPLADDLPSWSPYTYTLNNPISLFDPDGEYPWPVHVRSFISSSTTGLGLFRGDGRGASTSSYPAATSRVRSTFTVDPAQGTVTNASTVSDPTIFYGGRTPTGGYLPPATDTGTPSGTIGILASENGSLSVGFSHSGKDPLTPGALTPALDVQGGLSFNEDLKNGVLTITGSFTGNPFPSSEAFVVDQSGKAKIFLGAKKEQGGLLNLFGSGNSNSLFNVNMQIQFDDKGNFTGVQYDGQNYTIDEWNKRVQEGF